MTDTVAVPTITDPERTEPFVTWGCRAALASPFVALFGVAVGAAIYADDVSKVAGTGRFTVATVAALVVLLLLALGLVALYLRQAHALGRVGTGAFGLALVGTMLAAGGAWDQVFTVPYLADTAPTVVDGETSGSLLAGFVLSFTLLAAGWVSFAIATRRAGVLSRRGSAVLAVGGVLALVPAPTALRLLVLSAGAAMSARGVKTARRGAITGVAVAAAVLAAGCGGGDRLTSAEAADRISQLVGETSSAVQAQFHPIFERLEGLTEDDLVPDDVRADLPEPAGVVARVLRDVADEVDELDPPEDAEDAVGSLADAAREQADRVESLLEQDGLTVGDLIVALEPPVDALRRLGDAGIEVRIEQ